MKFLTKIFAFALAAVTVFAFSACSDKDETNADERGYALEIETETVDEKNVLTIKGFYVAQGTLNDIAAGIAKNIDLVIGDGEFNVYDESDKEFAFDKDGRANSTRFYKEFDEIVIERDAFASQKLIKTVKMTEKVTKIGAAAFAGCSNITKMELPFVGTQEKDAFNVNKTFASIFGTAEASGCTSMSVSYNASGTATYYLPENLTEVVINYSEPTALNAYAFAGLTGLKSVTLNNVNKIGNNAFAGCTGLNKVITDYGKIEVIGKAAFSGCTSLFGFKLNELTSLKTVYQEAFSGCAKLGLGYAEITLPVAEYMEKAFSGCTTLKKLNISGSTFGDSCFNGCTGLKELAGTAARLGNNVFAGCTELIKAGTVNEFGELN